MFFLCSAGAVCSLPWHWLLKLSLLILLLISYCNTLYKQIWQNSLNAVCAVWYNEVYWYALIRQRASSGELLRIKGKLTGGCYRSNLYLVLELFTPGNQAINQSAKRNRRRTRILIMRDAVAEAEYRYLSAGIQTYADIKL